MDRDQKLALIRRLFYRRAVPDLWFAELQRHITSGSVVLEIGSGSGKGKQNFLYPDVKKIVGIDLDERVLANPNLDEAHHISAYDIADVVGAQRFDVIYSQMVAEHIDDGRRFIAEQLKALDDNGVLIHSTVSKYYWTSLINDFVPEAVKFWLIRTLGSGRTEADVFPTHYQLNSARQIKEICEDLDVDFSIVRQDEPPGYLRRSLILMVIYTAIHKPLQLIFPALRPSLIFIVSGK
ncbi:methyltransferase domain-containing protein [Yoonia sp. GPGPB17]|uniref:class I SAM-dependent methyltransferase n=1 Tax=Yoonia sp. GPGPB17 TaxID=3026147 RepID=UPI0030C0710C